MQKIPESTGGKKPDLGKDQTPTFFPPNIANLINKFRGMVPVEIETLDGIDGPITTITYKKSNGEIHRMTYSGDTNSYLKFEADLTKEIDARNKKMNSVVQ